MKPLQWHIITHWATDADQQPALLLTGEGQTLEQAAQKSAKLVLCQQPGNQACGTCQACHLFDQKSHPDFLELEMGGGEAGIKALREILSKLALLPAGTRRVVLLSKVDAMSVPAATILLKSLEEPHPTTRWLLTTQFPQRLLATIKSRCQRIHLGNASRSTAAAVYGADAIVRLITLRELEELPNETLEAITAALTEKLQTQGPTANVRRAFFRLRDYYKIRALKGNEKLARDVLVASLP